MAVTLRSLVEVYGSGLEASASSSEQIAAHVDACISKLPAPLRFGVYSSLRLLEWSPRAVLREKFSTMGVDERQQWLERLIRRWAIVRPLDKLLRSFTLMAFYDLHPASAAVMELRRRSSRPPGSPDRATLSNPGRSPGEDLPSTVAK